MSRLGLQTEAHLESTQRNIPSAPAPIQRTNPSSGTPTSSRWSDLVRATSSNTNPPAATPPQPSMGFGNPVLHPRPNDVIRLFYKNIRGVMKRSDPTGSEWKELSLISATYGYDIIGLTETNYYWNTNRAYNLQQTLRRQIGTNCHIQWSRCCEPPVPGSTYQPGGTATIVTGPLADRIVPTEKHSDPTGMGRWSAVTIRRGHDGLLTILTFYRVCHQHQSGPFTSYSQQFRHLRNSGILNPNPRHQAIRDFTQTIRNLQAHQHSIIVMMDGNEPTGPGSAIQQFILDTGLVDVLRNRHGSGNIPPTTNNGSHQIDYVFVSATLIPGLLASGMQGEYTPPYATSDHRGIHADLGTAVLFNALDRHKATSKSRQLQSSKPAIARRYRTILSHLCHSNQIHDKLRRLCQIPLDQWLKQHSDQLDALDVQFTAMCLKAERKSSFPSDAPWSPAVHFGYLLQTYWKIQLSCSRRNVSMPQHSMELKNIIKKAFQTPDKYVPSQLTDAFPIELLTFESPAARSQVRKATQYMLMLRTHAIELRQQYHMSLLETLAFAEGDMEKQQKIIRRIQQAELRDRTFMMLKLHVKDQNKTSVTEIKVPVNPGDDPKDPSTTEWRTLRERNELESRLRSRNATHFAQARNTPFLQSPLQDLMGHSGLSQFSSSVCEGQADLSAFSSSVKNMLQACRSRSSPMDEFLPTDTDISNGFKKWRETTCTSPSGRHLGHYRSLVPASDDRIKVLEDDDTTDEANRKDLLSIVGDVIRLSIIHTVPLSRWCTIHNLFLRKKANDSRVHRHRVIHIQEADWTFIFKFFTAYKWMAHAESHNTLAEEAYGGRRHRQAIDMALAKVLTVDHIHLDQRPAWIFDKDATSCYDRIVESYANLSMVAKGHPTKVLQLHSKVFQRVKYYVVTNYGVSDEFNQYSTAQPFVGPGQGSGDSPARWVSVSSDIIKCYKQSARHFLFRHPLGPAHSPNLHLAMFVDDAFSCGNDNSSATQDNNWMYNAINRNAQLWESLLYVSGGKLELPKCSCTVFRFTPDKNGYPQLASTTDSPSCLSVHDSETGAPVTIPMLSPSKAYKTMGVHITGDQTWNDQYNALKETSDKYAVRFAHTSISGQYALLSYKSSYIPKMVYSLGVSGLTKAQCDRIQRQALAAFLPLMGINRHFPRALVFSSIQFGGLGLRHLYHEQGRLHVELFLRIYRQCDSTLAKLLATSVAYTQLVCGLSRPILQDTRETSYVPPSWVQHLRAFLRYSQSTIAIYQPWLPAPNRVNDRTIMDIVTESFSQRDQRAINTYRLYLQVQFISEIVDDTGNLLVGANGDTDDNGNPLLWHISESTLEWPHTSKPPPRLLRQWRKAVNLCSSVGRNLGPWLPVHHTTRRWTSYYHHSQKKLFRLDPEANEYDGYPISHSTRRSHIFQDLSDGAESTIQSGWVPVNHLKSWTIRIPAKIVAVSDPPAPPQSVDAPSLSHFIHQLSSWEHQMFKDYHWCLPHPEMASPPSLKVLCMGYHRTHGTHATIIQSSDEPVFHACGVNPTSLGHSSPSRSRLCALYTAVRVLAYWQLHLALPPTIIIAIDDSNIRRRLHTLLQSSPSARVDPLLDNYDLWMLLLTMFRGILGTCHVDIAHVPLPQQGSAHDDLTADEAMLYQLRDKARELHDDCTTPDPLPASTPSSPAGLLVQDTPVPNRIQETLRNAAADNALRIYFHDAYGWSSSTIAEIDWYPQGRVLANLPYTQRIRILKYIHGWLPTNARLHRHDSSIPIVCRSCDSAPETNFHFLCCPDDRRTSLWAKFHHDFRLHLTRTCTDPSLIPILCQGVRVWAWTETPPILPQLAVKNGPYERFFSSQTRIGWLHFLKGRWSSSLLDIQYAYRVAHRKGPTVEMWAYKLIHKIWTFVDELWTMRNDVQHAVDTDLGLTTDRLCVQIETVYALSEHLPAVDQTLFSQPIAQVLSLPVAYQQHWVTTQQAYLNQHLPSDARLEPPPPPSLNPSRPSASRGPRIRSGAPHGQRPRRQLPADFRPP